MLWAAFVVSAVIDWLAVVSNRPKVEQVFKPLTLIILLAAAGTAALDPSRVKPFLMAGLAFGLLGDIFLLRAVDRFKSGLVAFLIGHLAYIGALALTLASSNNAASGWTVAAVGIVSALLLSARLPSLFSALRLHHPRLTVPVVAYAMAIVVMVGLAVASGRPLTALGSVLFSGSDRLLAEDRFVQPGPATRWLVHAMYHLGQAAIVAGLLA